MWTWASHHCLLGGKWTEPDKSEKGLRGWGGRSGSPQRAPQKGKESNSSDLVLKVTWSAQQDLESCYPAQTLSRGLGFYLLYQD